MSEDVLSNSKRLIRGIFTVLAWLFFVCIIIQVFLAGIALFVDFGHWDYHKSFIHYFEYIPLLMVILSFFAKIPKTFRWQSLGLLIMIILQYVTVNLSGSVPYISALHPIIALLLFWRALVTAQTSKTLLKNS